ncbi:MAG: hypothetical protein U9N57_01080 [Pseudomonadota bacterium]|nr:hypothetical protein [Pseudomonadota bacterium]
MKINLIKQTKLSHLMRLLNCGYTFFLNEEDSNLINWGVEQGFTLKPSTTQAEWTQKGVDATRELTAELLIGESIQRVKSRLRRLRRKAKQADTLNDKLEILAKVKEAEAEIRKLRLGLFDAEDKAQKFMNLEWNQNWEPTGYYYLDKYFELRNEFQNKLKESKRYA